MEGTRNKRRRRLRRLAGLVLLAGLAGGIVLYRGAPDPQEAQEGATAEVLPLGPGDFKKSARELEVFGGKALLILEDWRQRLLVLGQTNGPALLVVAGSLAVAGLLLWIGGPQAAPPPRPESSTDRDKPRP